MEPLLDIHDLWVEGHTDNGWIPIIKGVSLRLVRGEMLGLIGESGSGKSTLGLAAMGFTRAGCRITRGSIRFDGLDLAVASKNIQQNVRGTRISYVAQSAAAAFNPAHQLMRQTIETTLLHGLKPLPSAQASAISLFTALNLPNPKNIGHRFPHQVSGGQLQRIMTAMALLPNPDLIIFDEPTTALDVTTQIEVLASIRRVVQERNVAAIFITHDLAVVAQMASKIKVLRKGETVEEGITTSMIQSPKEDYTKSLWSVRMLEKQSMPRDGVLLHLQGITAGYGTTQVLDNINLSVPISRTLAIVGESGSGKSTIAKVISGLLSPQKGTIRFDSTLIPGNFRKRSREQLRQIQMVHQLPDMALNPAHTVWDILARPIEFYFGLRERALLERVNELLELIELDASYMKRHPTSLSGGQKQRICIARAIAAKPQLMICDEITSSLDQVVQEGILKLLLRLQQELGMSYIFITHDIAAVRAVADEIVVMLKGQVIDCGSKEEVLSPPFHEYTARLLASVPEIDTRWLDRHLAEKKAY